jgi:hypothetical protein
MNCWKCSKQISDAIVKVGFRDTCPHCDTDLHTCTNCRYYAVGKPNDCLVPGTDYVKDREANNFCEEFKVQIALKPKIDKEKNKFNSLFNDNLEK